MSIKDAKLANEWVKQADRILITASNGLAISEGINLFANDQKLKEVLGDLVEKYHLSSLLQAFNFPYPNQLDYWRVVARIAEAYNYHYQTSSYMKQIKEVIDNKPYFVWTSNTDHHFVQAGFKNVLEVEGNWMTGICSLHPDEHQKVDLKEVLHSIYQKDQAGTLNDSDLPICQECGSPLELNVASENFQIDKKQIQAFRNFLAESETENLLVIELGIGPQNQMIKAPSMNLVASLPKSHYITINQGQVYIAPEIADRSIGFSSSIADAFKEIISGKSFGAQTQGPKAKEKSYLTPEQQRKQEEMMQKFYPNYMIDAAFHGSYPMYITLDQNHPSFLHGAETGQSWMYSIGDSASAHCFTPDGHYYKVELGLDKTKNQVHGFYVNPGTLIAIEANEGNSGFSQLSTNIPINDSGKILVPKIDQLLKLFPDQKELIKRLAKDD